MTIIEIKNYPDVIDNVHESIYKSYQALDKVKEMLKRGDSQKSILEVIEAIYHNDYKPSKAELDDLPF
jgi:hypothetical protein